MTSTVDTLEELARSAFSGTSAYECANTTRDTVTAAVAALQVFVAGDRPSHDGDGSGGTSSFGTPLGATTATAAATATTPQATPTATTATTTPSASTTTTGTTNPMWARLGALVNGSGTAAVGVPTPELGAMCGELLRLRALAEGAAMAVVLEAVGRGVVAEPACTDVAGWVREQGWQAGVGVTPALAAGFRAVSEQARTRKPADLRPLAAAVMAGAVPISSAKPLGRELDLLSRHVPEPVWHTAAAELIEWAAQGAAPGELRKARHRIAATYGTESFEEEQRCARRHREVSGWVADDAGGWTCQVRTDNEGRAILDAAFDALAGPSAEVAAVVASRPNLARALAFQPGALPDAGCPGDAVASDGCPSCGARPTDGLTPRVDPDTRRALDDILGPLTGTGSGPRDAREAQNVAGHTANDANRVANDSDQAAKEANQPANDSDQADIAALGRDTRTPGQRRHDALIELARVLATDPAALRDVRPTAATKAQVTITMDYDRLRAGLGAGIDGHGTPLTAATVRRMCCDAALIPAVLGGQGAILDWGRARRHASPDQIRYLRHRDKGCTFPGCDRPPAWCEAHHLNEWLIDRGDTNVDQLALLCARHHDIVHAHHLKGELAEGRVRWSRRATARSGAPARSTATAPTAATPPTAATAPTTQTELRRRRP